VPSAHNTPSPSFFASTAGASVPFVAGRYTHNPRSPLPPYLTRVRHARQLVVVSSEVRHEQAPWKTKGDMDHVEIIEDGGMVIGHDGLIVAVGTDAEIAAQYDRAPSAALALGEGGVAVESLSAYAYLHELDASGCVILPGLVDGHTHPVWAGDRVHEFSMKLAGATYMDVHKAGGGIAFTVEHTRRATEDELLSSLLARLDRALSMGTTLMEAKSGYGLDTETELKMLRVIERASRRHAVEVVATFCGAHSVPKGMTAAQATEDVIHKQLPAIMAAKAGSGCESDKECAGGLKTLEFIDVFCEKGVFELEDTRSILRAGLAAGLHANFHGDELSAIRAAELGAEVGATVVSHLEHVSDEGMAQMASAGVVATLLPTTAYILRIAPPPARKLIDAGVCVALGSDFNPNAHCLSMPLTANLACVHMGLTLPQALNALTLNGAASLRRAQSHGSLRQGKVGDFLLLDAPKWEHLIYQLGDTPIGYVFKRGKMVWKKQDGHVRQ